MWYSRPPGSGGHISSEGIFVGDEDEDEDDDEDGDEDGDEDDDEDGDEDEDKA